jgi:hypothetical protein
MAPSELSAYSGLGQRWIVGQSCRMDNHPPGPGLLTKTLAGVGPVTREMVHARARALALIAGHAPPHVTQAAYEQAKRELGAEESLQGESESDR